MAMFYNLQILQVYFCVKISFLFFFFFFFFSSTRKSAFRFRAQRSCDSYVLDVKEVLLLCLFQPTLVPVKGHVYVRACVRAQMCVCVCVCNVV